MTPSSDDQRLFEYYVQRGREPWNVSLASAWLEYELRRCVAELLPVRQPLRVCNVGIGVGLFDDWLGHEIGASITSVDRDPEICAVFALRQRREQHPFPARVVCGDAALVLAGQRFDAITCVGSTLGESGAPDELRSALTAALAPAGCLIIAEVRETAHSPGVAVVCTSTVAHGRPIHQP